MKKKKIDPIKEAEKNLRDTARMEQMSLATGPTRRTPHQAEGQAGAKAESNRKKR